MTIDADKLVSLGFEIVGGQLDYEHINYGRLTINGPLLTPDGEALVQSLDAVVASAAKRGRSRKVDVEAVSDVAEG